MVLEVTGELACGDTEEVFNEVSCKTNTLVGVVVLVVGVSSFNGHFQNLADNSTQVDGLLVTVFFVVSQVRKKFTVKKLVNPSFSVLFLLSSGEFLLKPFVAFVFGFNSVFFVVLDFVDVGNDKLE